MDLSDSPASPASPRVDCDELEEPDVSLGIRHWFVLKHGDFFRGHGF